jgi:single-stranded-DNA-specific exonuclease
MSASADWPAPAEALAAGHALLERGARGLVGIACDHDVDGLASGVLVARAVERLGGRAEIVPVGRAQHVHVPAYRDRVAVHRADAYVVTDMGSRAEPIGLPAPTLLVDHHDTDVFPPDVVVVSAARRLPVAPTSYLAFELLRPLVDIADLDWLGLLGSIADLGADADFGALPSWRARHRATHVSEAIALLNAARRSADHDVGTALAVLREAGSVAEIANGHSAGVTRLRTLRAEVAAEVTRVARTAPRIYGDVAVIRLRSKAQVHPLIAVRWKSRLAGKIVLVANEDFLPGRVSFVVRTTRSMDLLAWLRSLPIGDVGPDYARGHPAATGGNLAHDDFERLMQILAAGARVKQPRL